MRLGIHLVWREARRPAAATVALQAVNAIGLAAILQSGRTVVARLDEPGVTTGRLATPVTVLAAAMFVTGVATAVTRELNQVVGEQLERTVERDIAAAAISVPFPQYESEQFHDLLERTSSRAALSAFRLVFGLATLVETLATSLAVVAVLLASVPELLPVLALVSLPVMLASRASARLAYQTAYTLAPADRLRRSILQAMVGKATAREVRVLQLGRPFRTRWEALYRDRLARVQRLAARRGLLLALATAFTSALAGIVLWLLVRATVRGDIALADSAVAVVGFQQLLQRLRQASLSAGSLRESSLFLDDFAELRRYADDAAEGLPPPLELRDAVRVDDVHFTYPGTSREVLAGVSFTVRPGEIVAIVGSNGAGKTSLVHLLAGLYQPTSGAIRWDGLVTTDIGTDRLWRSIAVLFQDFGRFELSARDNIAIGDTTSSADIVAAAKRAGIDEALDALPDGYDTVLSRLFGGAELSVGQWQRLALARALYRAAPLVILDEPSASLDAESEALLINELRADASQRAVVIVSHRFSTVARADRILVVESGRVVEQGTHHELIARAGRYAQLFELQRIIN